MLYSSYTMLYYTAYRRVPKLRPRGLSLARTKRFPFARGVLTLARRGLEPDRQVTEKVRRRPLIAKK